MTAILVSACLLGQKVRYDGAAKTLDDDRLNRWANKGWLHPICPELLGGLPVPRLPAEIAPGHDGTSVLSGQGRILDLHGGDVTDAFLQGAKIAVATAQEHGCKYALLTEASPSCGTDVIYSGHHDGVRRAGMGVVTAALTQAGVQVFSSEQIGMLAALIDA
ncbi:hypothetical protein ALP8811_00052 [Aliiroseovarius pelagivivens]|uniref:Uncharacterized protein n=1 Tax=Aliiroseovarius pelagivivens TaxID=1639690 RepID=A0A2R8AGD5_9RHOB|nr:DUF523 domain-containing protein [Aliiroseovarius pelagivivens]SPF75068.1 hypothetical protein ALP8811_00052 [Aliiroseovarius pelagivivens]